MAFTYLRVKFAFVPLGEAAIVPGSGEVWIGRNGEIEIGAASSLAIIG